MNKRGMIKLTGVFLSIIMFAGLLASFDYCEESHMHDECVECACGQCCGNKLFIGQEKQSDSVFRVSFVSFYKTPIYKNIISKVIDRPPIFF